MPSSGAGGSWHPRRLLGGLQDEVEIVGVVGIPNEPTQPAVLFLADEVLRQRHDDVKRNEALQSTGALGGYPDRKRR